MISNEIVIEIGKNALLEPILLDYLDNYLEWNEAISSLEASANWGDTTAVSSLGTFNITTNNSAIFTPTSKGEASVNLVVNYKENNLVKQLQQTIKLKVIDGTLLETPISSLSDNRLVKVQDGLYVPELQVDLANHYINYTNQEQLNTTTNLTTEDNLVNLVETIANDILDIKSETIKLIASESISALKCVYYKNNEVRVLDYRDEDNIDFFLGITITAATQGSAITIKRTGLLQDSFFNFTLNKIFLGEFGSLTQIPPTTGYDLEIGVAVARDKLLLNVQSPIFLGN